jgi:hypothetical protein
VRLWKLRKMVNRTFVYVDGFNLYYRALAQKPYKWLSLYALATRLLPNNQIVEIKYYTAAFREIAIQTNQIAKLPTCGPYVQHLAFLFSMVNFSRKLLLALSYIRLLLARDMFRFTALKKKVRT